MAATPVSETNDGPVLNFINKRIRNLRKKLNRIVQLEDSISQGKPMIKEQEDLIRSKPSLHAAIEELEKIRSPLSSAVTEEVDLAIQRVSNDTVSQQPNNLNHSNISVTSNDDDNNNNNNNNNDGGAVVDLLNLLYFGSLFDVKSQSDFTATMLTRTHERGCCLTYDYVTDSDDAPDLLGETDLDLISRLGGLLISRPVDSSLSHKNALHRCIDHAKLWLSNSDHPIESNANVTYAGLRERLHKIMASDYFTTTPMKAPVEVAAAAAAGNYVPFQVPVPVHGSVVPISVPVQVEGSVAQYEQQQDEDATDFQEHETGDNQPSPPEEFQKDELETENPAEVVSVQQEQIKSQADMEHNQREVEHKEQQYNSRRTYQNQRGGRGGGGGGRRGYSNGRGGRSGGRGGYQNGRNQYYDQPINYYPRNYYNNRGRGGRGGGNSYNNHGSAVQGGHTPADVGVNS